MFHPYSIQGGTATIDPQIAGMNGQSRIPEMFGTAYPNIPGSIPFVTGTHTTGLPATAPIGYNTLPLNPALAAQFGCVSPWGIPQYVNPYITTACNPYVAMTQPFVNSIPTTPYVNPFVNHFPVAPVAGWNTIPTSTFGQPIFGAGQVIPTAFQNPVIPTPFGNVVTQPTTLIPTPMGYMPATIPTVNPFLASPTSWANYSFRTPYIQTPVTTTLGNAPFCGYPTPITGIPAIDAACCGLNPWTGSSISSLAALNPWAALANSCHPFASSCGSLINPVSGVNPYISAMNPFVANTALNYARINSPFGYGLNSLTGGVSTIPFNTISQVMQGANPLVNPIAALGINGCAPFATNPVAAMQAACFCNPMLATNPFATSLYGACNPTTTALFNGITSPTINPINGTTNPFFSPTNVAFGVPGYPVVPTSVGVTNPLSAVSTGLGQVCCN